MVGGCFVCVKERGLQSKLERKLGLVCNGGNQRKRERERNSKEKAKLR